MYFKHMQCRASTNLARTIFLCTTITKERSKFGISEVMVFMANLCTNCTYTNTIHHLAGVTVIPEIYINKFNELIPEISCPSRI